jgi:hypothetical protein
MKFIPPVVILIITFSAAYTQTEQVIEKTTQGKAPFIGRLVEKGNPTNGLKGETLLIYTPTNIDTLKSKEGGYITGEVTDVKTEETIEITTNEIYIKPSGTISSINSIGNAVLYNSNGEKIKDITEELQKGMSITDINIASGIYFLQLQEGKNIYNIKFVYGEGQVLGTNKIQTKTYINNKTGLGKTAL